MTGPTSQRNYSGSVHRKPKTDSALQSADSVAVDTVILDRRSTSESPSLYYRGLFSRLSRLTNWLMKVEEVW